MVAGLLGACNRATFDPSQHDPNQPTDVFDRIRSIDLLPHDPAPQEHEAGVPGPGRATVYEGASVAAVAHVDSRDHTAPVADGDNYELNFENTPTAAVAKTILGDILGVGYTIDPRVQGTISLSSGRPVPKADILYTLESALRISNVVLTHDVAGYHLVPLGEAVGSAGVNYDVANVEPGYGVSVVPLQYVSAPTLIKLLDSFATKPGMVRADSARNMLLVQGSGPERRTAVETILSFDADWMRGESVAIFPVHNSTPEPLITELEKIVDSGEGGLGRDLIKFQSISRMNSILAVSRKPKLLTVAASWIARLDRGDESGKAVHVYRLRYGDSRQMARVLNEILLGGSASTGLEGPTNQIAPGSGAIASTSGAQGLSGSQFGAGFGSGFGSTSQSNSDERVRSQLGITPPSQHDNASAGAANASAGLGGQGSNQPAAPMLTGVRITADVTNNALLVFASMENYQIIERAIRQLDRPQMQVAIEATIAEVTLNNNLNYGVQFFLTSQNFGLHPDTGSGLNTAATQPPAINASGVASSFLSRTFPAFNFLVGPEAQPQLILDALHQVTTVKVLSNPSLVVMDSQPAVLEVGDQVPISTGSATVLTTSNTIVNTIDYRDTGIILRIIPRVNTNGIVRLDVEQEISNVEPTTAATALTPTFSQRRIKSSITVTSGQTVLLAGLISETQDRGSTGIPFLDELPGPLGDAFATMRNTGITRTELIMFIRPQVIRDGVDAQFVAEDLRSKLRGTAGAKTPLGPLTTKLQ